MKRIIKTSCRIYVLFGVSAVAFFGLAACGVAYGYKEAESRYMNELPAEASQQQEDFRELHRIVTKNYSLYASKHIDMDSLYRVFSHCLKTETSPGAGYGLLLREYFAALHVGHANVFLKGYSAYASPVFIRDTLFVDHPNGRAGGTKTGSWPSTGCPSPHGLTGTGSTSRHPLRRRGG